MQRGLRQARKGQPLLLDQLPELAAELRAAYQAVLRTAAADMALSYAAEWLLDNFYVVEQALYLIQNDLPETFYRQLPVLDGDWSRQRLPACLCAGACLCGSRAGCGRSEPVAALRARLSGDTTTYHG